MPVHSTQAVLGDLDTEEVEEFALISESAERRKLRNRIMAADNTGHTSLVYVKRPDGVTTKMRAADADEYVKLTKGAEIVKRGTRPEPEEHEVIGATKARVGEMFGPDGRQIADVQPMTTRTFMPADSNADSVRTPAIGGVGAAGEVTNSQGATTPKRPTAHVPVSNKPTDTAATTE